MSELLLDRAGRRRSPATMPGFTPATLPATSICATRQIRRRLKRSSPSCAPPATNARPPPTWTDRDLVAIGAAHPGSARAHRERPRSPPRLAAGPAWQGREAARGRHGRVGLGATRSLARAAARAPGRSAAVRHQRHHARSHWSPAAARAELRRTAAAAGARRRFAPHQLRHAHAVEMAREVVPLIVIQCQLGHSNLGITSVYLQGIDSGEIIETVHARRAPMIPVVRGAPRRA